MADIIIRKAKKNYVCDVCGHIIRSGEEYLDKVITHDTKVVRHERYHDECPMSSAKIINDFLRKFISCTELVAVNNATHDKYHVYGIDRDQTVRLFTWDYKDSVYVQLNTFITEYTYE